MEERKIMTMQTSFVHQARMVRARENGQAATFLLLVLGIFLLGGIGLAVDLANMWFHRQSAQNAADAACTAAAMDLVNNANGATNSGGFTPGTAFNCSINSTAAPCQYAAFNGYTATTGGLQTNSPSVDTAISFPSSVSGVQSCSASPAPSVCAQAGFTTFVRATVTDRTQSFFIGMLSGGTTMNVPATATCGAVLSTAPIPILVLDPRNETSLDNNGNFTIQIVGGPQRSIQVNAVSSSAVNVSGNSGVFNLSQGGPFSPPATHGSGSDFGVTGTESATNYNGGTTGNWIDPTAPISDPFATLQYPTTVPPAPVRPSDLTAAQCASIPCAVPSGTHGCQVTGTNGDTNCLLYTAGHYTTTITSFRQTLIFDPGVYYMDGDLVADQQSCLRPATGVGDGSGGTMFYFNGAKTVNVSANAGTWGICGTSTLVPLSQLYCVASGTGATQLPGNVVSQGGLLGNVLLGACQAPTAGGTNYGDPLGTSDPLGVQRGMLFFQDRSGNLAAAGNQPSWGGGGSFGLTGVMYFHYCNSADGAHLGSNCNTGTTTGYTDQLSLQGGSCSSTFVIGDVITDKLHLGGNPCIEMDLNPNALYYVLKASLLQ
jgi:hypothetical protein